jgi:ATP-binding cassette, subfamily A (ABC1), member 3
MLTRNQVPPSNFGVGTAVPVRSLSDAVAASAGGRDTVVFINNGYTGGAISSVIDQLSTPIQAQGKTVQVLQSDEGLLTICRSSIRGVSPCFAAVDFLSSPTEGPDGVWNVTYRADGSFGGMLRLHTSNTRGYLHTLL